MKKVVVTGALGYLGSKLVEHLLDSFPEMEIFAIDDLSSGNPDVLASKKKFRRVELVQASILNLELPLYFKRADAVFHLAAITDPSSSFENADQVFRVNTEGTQWVGEACAHTKSFLVFPSTTSVYAKQDGIISEDDADKWLDPQTPYAQSKLKAEQILHKIAAVSDLKYSILRFGTLFGVSRGMHFRTAVQKFCCEAVQTGRVTVWESALDQIRPYCDIQDAVRAMIFCVQGKNLEWRMAHAASEHATPRQLVKFLKVFFPRLEIQTVKHPAMNDFFYEVSCDRLKTAGFKFKGSLQRGMEEVINFLSSEKDTTPS